MASTLSNPSMETPKPLDLSPVDPDVFDRAARRFINTPPPPKGWKPPKVEKPKKEGGGK